ncbi:MAG: radical SAM protein [Candidatus Komeilibacteria bacterium]|nr:radical SAM protein [Candidatus Komeilibacteria bacterium]
MIPALVQWELTERCNYRCQHCYRLDTTGAPGPAQELSDGQMWQIARKLIENRLFFVTLTGGEPLVRKNLAVDLCRFLTENGVRVSLNTNLLLMDEVSFGKFQLRGLLISCPSANPVLYRLVTGNGDYRRFERKLKFVLSSAAHCTVNMVVNRLNLGDIRATALKLAKLGVKSFAATPVSLNPRAPRPDLLLSLEELRGVLEDLIWVNQELGLEVDVMEALPKCAIPVRAFELKLPFIGRSCFAGKRNGTISPAGEVRPCGHNPNSFGNILKEEVSDIWERLGNWRENTGNHHRNCLACDIQSSCDGGCRFSGHPQDPSAVTVQKYLEVSPASNRCSAQILFTPQTIVRPYRQILARREGDNWLLCSNSPRNLLTVNQDLYGFILQTRQIQPTAIADLAENFGSNFNDPDFQSVMTTLISKSYFLVC